MENLTTKPAPVPLRVLLWAVIRAGTKSGSDERFRLQAAMNSAAGCERIQTHEGVIPTTVVLHDEPPPSIRAQKHEETLPEWKQILRLIERIGDAVEDYDNVLIQEAALTYWLEQLERGTSPLPGPPLGDLEEP